MMNVVTTIRKHEPAIMNDIDIRQEREHYSVYVNGKFFCSADTYDEACRELRREGLA